jgi:predicted small secreted protein
MLKRTAALLALSCLALLLAACNTIEGAGKDVKATGSAVERAAEKAKPY